MNPMFWGILPVRLIALDDTTKRRKRQLLLRLEAELDRYLKGEIDEIRLERRGNDETDHITVSRVIGYKPLRNAA